MPKGAPKVDDAAMLEVDGHAVRISSPGKPYFTKDVKLTKLEIVRYFLSVAPGALRGIAGRPIVLKRFVNGAVRVRTSYTHWDRLRQRHEEVEMQRQAIEQERDEAASASSIRCQVNSS